MNGQPSKDGGRFLEPHSQPKKMPDSQTILEGQLRECFGRVVYSHKTHEKCADILLLRLSRIKLCQIILSAITTGGCISFVFGAGEASVLIGATASTLLLILNLYTKDHSLGELSEKHRQVGAELWKIREKYLSLITDLRIRNKSIEMLQAERDNLLEELHSIYSTAPSTTLKAYKEAQKALKLSGDMTFSDEEIDAFLPNQLKKNLNDNSPKNE